MSQVFSSGEPFTLESGKVLQGFHLSYTTAGRLNEAKDNVVWIFHALTANSNPIEWWPGLVGPGHFFDPERYFIVCVNMPGSCYGSISALDENAATGKPYYHTFPLFTTRDMIRAYQHLKAALGIDKIKIGIGGSMGGQQLLEWAIEEPSLFEYIIPIATNAFHSAWGIAFNTSQRLCIASDPSWKESHPAAGLEGMKLARSIALLSYRHYDTYQKAQSGVTENTAALPVDEQVFKASTYQQYQGDKLAKRFTAFSYYFLSKAMDTHNVGRNRVSAEEALQRIQAKTLVIGISTDILFPPAEQEFIARHIPGAQVAIIDSLYGHDGFLLEYDNITRLLNNFIQTQPAGITTAALINS
ncbi:homoserine O-acetyltransferase family protein [Filimonas effusa]|uniref:Homoserine O-acetyltransferase n=1 Tax=Filimonas effusa TaxID=2508721 RepID=A0A4Q1D3X4_9BACT|nr:homoserine O-acetyltransferase [Filimonas effusa]RXK83038.1 homoserine O-acetyltransferase [Filimonas effusa]